MAQEEAAMADQKGFTQAQVDALVAKLRAVDLTDDERVLLQTIFRKAAESADVAGFAFNLGSQLFATVYAKGGRTKTWSSCGGRAARSGSSRQATVWAQCLHKRRQRWRTRRDSSRPRSTLSWPSSGRST